MTEIKTEQEAKYDLDELELTQIKEKYPDFRITQREFRMGIIPPILKGFLYSKKYREFDAKFYVSLTPEASIGANIYTKGEFQYSVSTNSGNWNEKLKHLEEIVKDIGEKGFSSVRSKFNSKNLNMSFNEF